MNEPTNLRTESALSGDIRTVGDRIRIRRKALAMTQRELAEELDVGQQTVGRWENGDIPQRRHWGPIARFLGLAGEGDIRTLLAVGDASANVIHLHGSKGLAKTAGTRWSDALNQAIIERIAKGPLSDAEVAFFRDLLALDRAQA